MINPLSGNMSPDFSVITGVDHSAVTGVIGQYGEGVITCHDIPASLLPSLCCPIRDREGIEYDKCIWYWTACWVADRWFHKGLWRTHLLAGAAADVFPICCCSRLILFRALAVAGYASVGSRRDIWDVKTECLIDPFSFLMALYSTRTVAYDQSHFRYSTKWG